jgi:paraquat-inducible protein B
VADAPHSPDLSDIPEAVAVPKSHMSLQLVWVIPLVAALIGGWLAVKTILERGPTITISFKTAEGLESGKTKIKYKDVEIGMVTSVTLFKDLTRVIATAELVKGAEPYLVEDTRFGSYVHASLVALYPDSVRFSAAPISGVISANPQKVGATTSASKYRR